MQRKTNISDFSKWTASLDFMLPSISDLPDNEDKVSIGDYFGLENHEYPHQESLSLQNRSDISFHSIENIPCLFAESDDLQPSHQESDGQEDHNLSFFMLDDSPQEPEQKESKIVEDLIPKKNSISRRSTATSLNDNVTEMTDIKEVKVLQIVKSSSQPV